MRSNECDSSEFVAKLRTNNNTSRWCVRLDISLQGVSQSIEKKKYTFISFWYILLHFTFLAVLPQWLFSFIMSLISYLEDWRGRKENLFYYSPISFCNALWPNASYVPSNAYCFTNSSLENSFTICLLGKKSKTWF